MSPVKTSARSSVGFMPGTNRRTPGPRACGQSWLLCSQTTRTRFSGVPLPRTWRNSVWPLPKWPSAGFGRTAVAAHKPLPNLSRTFCRRFRALGSCDHPLCGSFSLAGRAGRDWTGDGRASCDDRVPGLAVCLLTRPATDTIPAHDATLAAFADCFGFGGRWRSKNSLRRRYQLPSPDRGAGNR